MATVNRSASITSTRFTSKVVIDGEDVDVVFDGVDFTGNGYVEIKNARSVTFKNCRVYGIIPDKAKSYWLSGFDFEKTIKLVMETCFFGANPNDGTNKLYNLIEPQFILADGSSFSYNYFHDGCCTHNMVSLYGFAENANVNVNGNSFDINGIRIGNVGNPVCTLNMKNNVVKSVISDVYAGVCVIQSYPNKTTSFSNMQIVMKDNTVPTDRVYYIYPGKDLDITEETAPKMSLNDVDVAFEDLDIVR